MKVLYTVDRARTLMEGMILELIPNPVSDEPCKSYINQNHSKGISFHGKRYIANPNCSFSNHNNNAMELYFEEIRRNHYSEIPSRFECIFCCETHDDAIRMRERLSPDDLLAPIFEINTINETHRVNMELINSGGPLLLTHFRAHAYWNGEEMLTDVPPAWEVLAKLPVVVGKKIG